MKKIGFTLFLSYLIFACHPVNADDSFRVLWQGTGGWGEKSAYCALFDTKTIQTFRGIVVSMNEVKPMPGMRPGLELQLKVKTDVLTVHVGPLWYVENQDVDIHPNDTVRVKGSKISCNGQPVIAAMEIWKGDQALRLRDSKGRPLWVATTQP